jgi:hypothetical protein
VERGCGERGLLDRNELAEADGWRRSESARELGPSAAFAELIVASRKAHYRMRLRRVMLLALGILLAIAVTIAYLRLTTTTHDLGEEKGRSDIQISVQERAFVRGAGAHAGDLLTVEPRHNKYKLFDLRIYHGRETLVARCPDGPHCIDAGNNRVRIEYSLGIGVYYIVFITRLPMMSDASRVDDFFIFAQMTTPGEYSNPAIEVHTLEVR